MSSLLSHGFLDITTTPVLSDICDLSSCVNNVVRLGSEHVIHEETWRFLVRSLDATVETRVGWCMGDRIDGGSYGSLYWAKRMVLIKGPDGRFIQHEPAKLVAVKRVPIMDTTTTEVLVHILAWRALQGTAVPWAIPHPYEVFADNQNLYFCMNYIKADTLIVHLGNTWSTETREANTRVFLELLGQLAYILHFLQVGLRLNHRDLKIDNLMIHRRTTKLTHLMLDNYQMYSSYAVILVDFGFACIDCRPASILQAGRWFGATDACFKSGRDLAQLIYCLNCYYPLHLYLTDAVFTVVQRWMQVRYKGGEVNMLGGVSKKGDPNMDWVSPQFHEGIYNFLQREDVNPVACRPSAVFRSVCQMISTAA